MNSVVLGGQVLLAAVFTIAALAKIADRKGLRQAVEDFGVPASLAAPVAAILPASELAIAVGLMASSSARWAALGALALMVLFSVAIAVNLAHGRKPDCHCFGRLHSAPAGPSTLARNGALVAVASLVTWHGWTDRSPSVISSVGNISTAQASGLAAGVVVVGLAIVQGWFTMHLLRQHGRLLVRMDALDAAVRRGGASMPSEPGLEAAGLPVGSQAPEFALSGLHGETLTLAALRSAGKPVMLLFTAPGCAPCESLMPDVGQWQRQYAGELTVAVVSSGEPDAVAAVAAEHELRNVLRQREWEVAENYQFLGTPSAVVVDRDGRIASPLVAGPDAIRALVGRVVDPRPAVPVLLGHRHGDVPGPSPGDSPGIPAFGDLAPAVRLPDLDGRMRELAEFSGSDTVVLFWNPGCGFCEQMLPDLKAWEEQPREGTPQLVVVSTGSVETNRAMGLRSPVLLDSASEAMHAFGARGTPMAVLVGPDGRIASREMAAGRHAVMALTGGLSPSGRGTEALQEPASEPGDRRQRSEAP